MVGMRVEDQPDTVYGHSWAEVYRQAKEMGQPILDEVDAFVEWPVVGRERRRFQRLVLPFRMKCGDTYLLGTTLEDLSIDLRGELR